MGSCMCIMNHWPKFLCTLSSFTWHWTCLYKFSLVVIKLCKLFIDHNIFCKSHEYETGVFKYLYNMLRCLFNFIHWSINFIFQNNRMFLIYEIVWIQNIRNNMYTGLFLYCMILKYQNHCTYIQAQLQCIISKVPLVHMLIWAMASENFMHLKHKGNSPPFQSIAYTFCTELKYFNKMSAFTEFQNLDQHIEFWSRFC